MKNTNLVQLPTTVSTVNKRFRFKVIIFHLLELVFLNNTESKIRANSGLKARNDKILRLEIKNWILESYVCVWVGSSPNVTESPGISLKHF